MRSEDNVTIHMIFACGNGAVIGHVTQYFVPCDLFLSVHIRYSSKVMSHSLATYTLATRMLNTLNSIALKRLSRDKTLEGLLT